MSTKVLPKPIASNRFVYLNRKYILLNVLLVVFLLAATNYYTLEHSWDDVKRDLEQVNSCNERLTKQNIVLRSERDAAIREIRNRDALLLWAGKYIAERQKGAKK